MTFTTRLGAVLLALFLGATAARAEHIRSAFVVLGPQGAPVARVITAAPACPAVTVDGRRRPMRLRKGAGTEPLRPTRSTPELSKPSAFPVSVCETTLPRTAKRVSVAGKRLPTIRARYDRIVVIGDTGCRIKVSDKAYQACNDAKDYPFARVAALAAAWKPDLVLHVGDYLYRENPCPADQSGCAGSPWGYGWDAWDADFFTPAAPLLAAAPWILVRGNHENCARAGQGWWRFLEPRALQAGRDCNDAANDAKGDADDPYAVPIGAGVQFAVLDLADTTNGPIPPTSPLFAQFRDSYVKLDALTRRAHDTFLTLHHPPLGFYAPKPEMVAPAAAGIDSVFHALNPQTLLPRGVKAIFSGHIHLWEEISFSSAHPTQFVAGFAGTQEDTVPLPATIPPGTTPAQGAVVDRFSSWVDGFGFMTLERTGPGTWIAEIHDLDGHVRNLCNVMDRHSACEMGKVR